MSKFKDLIQTRRSMRKYTDEAVSQDDIRLIMRAALMAPTSKGTHSYEFYVVEDKAKIEALAQCKERGAEFVASAPVAIVVMGNPEVSDVWIEDASIASIMIQLQAEELGLGTCWAQVRERSQADGTSAEEVVKQIVGAPAHMRVLNVIGLGHKGMERKPQNEEKLLWDKVHRL